MKATRCCNPDELCELAQNMYGAANDSELIIQMLAKKYNISCRRLIKILSRNKQRQTHIIVNNLGKNT